MIGDTLGPARGRPGRPRRPSKPLETFLDDFVKFEYHERHDLHHSGDLARSAFREEDYADMSDQGFRNYMRQANLPWPVLPNNHHEMVAIVWAEEPYPLTWATTSLFEKLSYPREALLNMPVVPLLRDQSREHLAALQHAMHWTANSKETLQETFTNEVHCGDGSWLPVEALVRYTGAAHHRFYCVIRPTGPAIMDHCTTCHGKGLVRLDLPVTHPHFGQAIPCPRCSPPSNIEVFNTGEVLAPRLTFPRTERLARRFGMTVEGDTRQTVYRWRDPNRQ